MIESVRKWGATENASNSEEVMVSRENCVIWTCMTSTPRKISYDGNAERVRWEHHATSMREKRNLCRVLVGNLAEKRVLERGSDKEREKQVFYFCQFLILQSICVR